MIYASAIYFSTDRITPTADDIERNTTTRANLLTILNYDASTSWNWHEVVTINDTAMMVLHGVDHAGRAFWIAASCDDAPMAYALHYTSNACVLDRHETWHNT